MAEDDPQMVARKQGAQSFETVQRQSLGGKFLLAWRDLLTRFVYSIAPPSTRAHPGPAAASPRPAEVPWPERAWVLPVAVASLLIGAIGAVAIAPAGEARKLAVAASVASCLYAPLRLVLLRLAASRPVRDPRAITAAWAVGLVVYAIGFTPALRLLAWAASGLLTWYALQRLGTARREASVLVSVAWGTQAGVVVLSWIARNAYLAILTTRG